MRPFRSYKISKRDAREWKGMLFDVTMIFPKEDPPKRRVYCGMKRKELDGFLKRMEKKGAYFLEINP